MSTEQARGWMAVCLGMGRVFSLTLIPMRPWTFNLVFSFVLCYYDTCF